MNYNTVLIRWLIQVNRREYREIDGEKEKSIYCGVGARQRNKTCEVTYLYYHRLRLVVIRGYVRFMCATVSWSLLISPSLWA